MTTGNRGKTENLKPFQAGQSGNPNGRPKIAEEFRDNCRTFMAEGGWDKLKSIVEDDKHRDRFRALELIMGYAYGKPKQGLELTGEEGDAIKIVYTTKWGNSNDGEGD
jgi:hypothetical protein